MCFGLIWLKHGLLLYGRFEEGVMDSPLEVGQGPPSEVGGPVGSLGV